VHYIYKIQNIINGKVYIGQSLRPSARWVQHKYKAKNIIKRRPFYLGVIAQLFIG